MAVFLAALLGSSGALSAPEGIGHLQVKAAPGASLLLDGTDRGVTQGDDGFVFRDLAAGLHRIEAWMPGAIRQAAVVLVSAGSVTVHRLRPFQPVPVARPQRPGEASLPDATGALIVHALPVKATIDSSGLGWKKIPIGEEPFVAISVPKGRHKLTFCNPIKCLDYNATIKTDDVVSLLVDFEPGLVHDVTREHKAEWASWRDACSNRSDAAACLRLCAIQSALEPEGRAPACAALVREAPRIASNPSIAPTAPTALNARQEPARASAKQGPGSRGVEASSSALTPPCTALEGSPPGFIRVPSPAQKEHERVEYEVFVGDKKLGNTPIAKVELPAGCVELRVVNRALGVDRKVRIEVEPGQVSIVRF